MHLLKNILISAMALGVLLFVGGMFLDNTLLKLVGLYLEAGGAAGGVLFAIGIMIKRAVGGSASPAPVTKKQIWLMRILAAGFLLAAILEFVGQSMIWAVFYAAGAAYSLYWLYTHPSSQAS